MKLQYRLDEEVEIEGVSYQIDLSFDTVLRLFDLLKDPSFSEPEKIIVGINLLLKVSLLYDIETQYEIFLSILQAFDIWEKPKPRYDRKGNLLKPKMKDIAEKVYSFDHDASSIFAAFYQAYQIDLFEEQGKMRWEKFIALFNGLPDDTQFKSIVDIRRREMPTGKGSQKARKKLKEAKQAYALPREGDEDE